ncbi:hypothetical protein P8C59_002752 [Phyllachora maydis]|uniref:Uncharacterized protein n=1 Tax=Phyllachora maydis TaxID=1825666 RepID=A0AAD9MAN1_9PEZI|nr:hypothetical protein P8C59_002752 [Phyllachora maydis]
MSGIVQFWRKLYHTSYYMTPFSAPSAARELTGSWACERDFRAAKPHKQLRLARGVQKGRPRCYGNQRRSRRASRKLGWIHRPMPPTESTRSTWPKNEGPGQAIPAAPSHRHLDDHTEKRNANCENNCELRAPNRGPKDRRNRAE